jgi:hypothetical protein
MGHDKNEVYRILFASVKKNRQRFESIGAADLSCLPEELNHHA